MVRMLIPALIVAALPVAAHAQDKAGKPPEKVRSVILYGDDQCPPSTDGEIVVCAKAGESPYRIPKQFRHQKPNPAQESWVNKVEMVEDATRPGMPNSCSPVGTGGQTGCTSLMIQQWARQRQQAQQGDSGE